MKKCKHCLKEVQDQATRCEYCSGDLRSWFRRHWILTTIGCVIILGAVTNSVSPPKSNNSGNDSSDSSQGTVIEEVEPVEEAIKVNANDLYAEYKQNEIAADQKYDNKILEVSGTIQSIGKDILEDMYVSLKTDDIIGSVQCMLADEEANKAATLAEGQTITLKGKNTGLLMNVILRDCVIQ